MSGRLLAIGGGLIVLLLAVIGITVFRPPEEASAPLQAVPLATSVPTAAAQASAAPATAPASAASATPASEATAAAAAATADLPTPATAPVSAAALFEIVSNESEARFLIDEVLRGSPITVVGSTNQVAGQLSVDPANPQNAQVGVIQINARTLETDNDFRNRAIKNVILRTNEFELVTFSPTSISGLPATVNVGEPFTFQMTGDLTITDVTRSVTFDVSVTPVSETRLEGLAQTSIAYRDFALSIPDAPSVDTVADEVRLELAFVAQPVQ